MESNVHPRFEALKELSDKYSHRLVIEGDIESPRNLLRLAIFKQKRYNDWHTFRVNDELYYIFYNEK